MKIYVDAYLAKNLGDDLFVNILTNRSSPKFFAKYASTYIFILLIPFS